MRKIDTIQKFFSPILEHPRDYFWNIFCSLIVVFYSIFTLEITRKIIIAIQDSKREEFFFLLILLALGSVIFVGQRFLFYKAGWAPIMHNGISIYIKKYLRQFIHAEGNEVERIGTGKFLTTLDKGLHDWFDLLFEFSSKGVINITFSIYVIITIFQISTIAGCISIFLFVLSGVVATIANYWMTEKRIKRRDAFHEALHNTTIVIMSKNELLQNASLTQSFLQKITKYLSDARRFHEPVQIGFLVIEEFPRIMLLALRIGLYLTLANSLWNGGASFADFAIFITIITLGERALNEFLHLTRDALRMFTYVERLWDIFGTLKSIDGYEDGKIFEPKKDGNIILENISFGYKDEDLLFENFSLTVFSGKKTALVGASGGGKTTLMKLIAGYLSPTDGYISVAGNILSETALYSYFPHIGYLTQDPSIFDGTIRENLASAQSEGCSEEEIERALRMAECDFVFSMKNKLDTHIGEKGVRLSGGQKQRLAIAKIFLKDPRIILLDEPTSALDSFSEERITEAMHRLFQGRTVIVIAHRLQTVKEADDIVVIEEGQLVERGNHRELMQKKGVYRKMLDLQSGF